jgi:hypothetical protein
VQLGRDLGLRRLDKGAVRVFVDANRRVQHLPGLRQVTASPEPRSQSSLRRRLTECARLAYGDVVQLRQEVSDLFELALATTAPLIEETPDKPLQPRSRRGRGSTRPRASRPRARG